MVRSIPVHPVVMHQKVHCSREGFFVFQVNFFFFAIWHSSSLKAPVFFFFFCFVCARLSARISDFENILLMVHVGGVHACAAGARYATFFFTNARF